MPVPGSTMCMQRICTTPRTRSKNRICVLRRRLHDARSRKSRKEPGTKAATLGKETRLETRICGTLVRKPEDKHRTTTTRSYRMGRAHENHRQYRLQIHQGNARFRRCGKLHEPTV